MEKTTEKQILERDCGLRPNIGAAHRKVVLCVQIEL